MSDLVLIVIIGGRRVAFWSDEVNSVIELGEITPVPRAPDFIVGLTALRSRALTVIDTCKALGINNPGGPIDERAPVFEIDGHSYALQVDLVEDVSPALNDPVRPDATLGKDWQKIARGIVETAFGPAILADAARIISGPDKTP